MILKINDNNYNQLFFHNYKKSFYVQIIRILCMLSIQIGIWPNIELFYSQKFMSNMHHFRVKFLNYITNHIQS